MRRAVLLFLAIPAVMMAHEGEPLAPHDLWGAWEFDPAVVIALALSGLLYFRGSRPVWRGEDKGHGIRPWEAWCFWLGWASLILALVSPLHALGGALFSAHMAQHEILMAIAAPLLVLGRPVVPFLWGLPASWRRPASAWSKAAPVQRGWRTVTDPFTAWILHAIALWIWHAPALFQATLTSELVHTAQHLSFLLSALLFWWALFRRRDARMGYGAAVFYVFSTGLHASILGALLTFAHSSWYPAYASRTAAWGLTPLEDQQLAGLIMWVPAGTLYVIAGLALFAAWLRESDARVADFERRLGISARETAGMLAVVLVSAGLWSCGNPAVGAAERLTGGNPERGREAIQRIGCGACHTIHGVPGATAKIGPPLNGIGGRAYVAGVLPNTPENMIKWIQHPKAVDDRTAMPDMGVSEKDARDITAYLYTLN